MQNKTGYIIAGVVGAMLMMILVLVGVVGWLVTRQVGTAVQSAMETAVAVVETTAVVESAETTAPIVVPTIVPTDAPSKPTSTEAAPSELKTEAATPTTVAGDVPDATTTALPVAVDPPSVPEDVGDFAGALTTTSQDALGQHPGAPVYQIGARFDPDQRTITGAQTLTVTNNEDVPLGELYLRLYPNAAFYDEGGIEVSNLRVGGLPAQPTSEVDDTALKIALAQPLAVGDSVVVELDFVTTVPEFGAGYGIFGVANGVFALYNWYPELAVYEEGGWLLNPVGEQGDPTNTDVANYAVTLTTPQDVRVITSGVEAEPRALARNFVMVLGDEFVEASQTVGDVVVNSYYFEDDEKGGKEALASAARSVEIFNKAFGAYPYPELDVAEVKLGGGAAGMESTGLIMIGSDLYAPESSDILAGLEVLVPGASDVTTIAFVTAHEVAHQWWYGVVGSDAYQQPWLDESITNWSSAYYMDEAVGPDAGLLARDIFIGFPYRAVLAQGDQRLDQPVDRFDEEEYSAIVYGKGALMYDVLREEIGDERFWAFVRDYYAANRFGRVDGEVWEATLAKHTDPTTAAEFVEKWVEGSNIRADDLPPGGPMQGVLSGDLSGLDINKLIPTPEP
jgi:hypothetical protein